jgi:hypothetical protein
MLRIRASALPSWNDCPRRESTKLFSKLIGDLSPDYRFPSERKGIGAAVGTGAHKGAAHAMALKRDGAVSVRHSEIEEVSILKFREEIATGDGVMQYDTATPNVSIAERQIRDLTRIWFNSFYPATDPAEVEKPLSYTFDDQFEFTGTPDVIERSNVISDYKFGAIPRKYQAQLGAYAYLAKYTGVIRSVPKTLKTIWIPRGKEGRINEPVVFEYKPSLCIHMASDVTRVIIAQLTAFTESGKPESFPANPMSMLCGNKYCRAFGSAWCKYGTSYKQDCKKEYV